MKDTSHYQDKTENAKRNYQQTLNCALPNIYSYLNVRSNRESSHLLLYL